MNIADVVQKAKEKQGLTSDMALGKLLKKSDVTILYWRKGRAIPKMDAAYDLAILAGIDPADFIADCLILAEQRPKVQQTLKRFKTALAAFSVNHAIDYAHKNFDRFYARLTAFRLAW